MRFQVSFQINHPVSPRSCRCVTSEQSKQTYYELLSVLAGALGTSFGPSGLQEHSVQPGKDLRGPNRRWLLFAPKLIPGTLQGPWGLLLWPRRSDCLRCPRQCHDLCQGGRQVRCLGNARRPQKISYLGPRRAQALVLVALQGGCKSQRACVGGLGGRNFCFQDFQALPLGTRFW